MRYWLVRATAAAVLIGGASMAFAYSTGPPFARTNAPPVANKPKEGVCAACHNGNGTLPDVDPAGSVTLVGVPRQYVPSGIYALEVHLNYDWSQDPFAGDTPRKWGFEITSVCAASGDSAGYWQRIGIPPDQLGFAVPPGPSSPFKARNWLEHTVNDIHVGENQDGQSGPIVWHFNWVAPAADSGEIYFFVAGNAANGDAMAFGSDDHIYTTMDSTVMNPDLTGVGPPHLGKFPTSFDRPYPNPMSKCVNLQFEVGKEGPVDLSVFDVTGRRVRTIVHDRLSANAYGQFWDGRDDARAPMKNGVYFVRLIAPGLEKPISYRLVLAR